MPHKEIYLNQALVRRQNLTKEEEQHIVDLHVKKSHLFFEMQGFARLGNKKELQKRAALITDLEFQLQRAWKFTEDINYHKFWEMPGCSCAKLDNNDAWPTGYYSRSGGCLIHGDYVNQRIIELKKKEEVTRVQPEPEIEMVTIPKATYRSMMDKLKELGVLVEDPLRTYDGKRP
jgi:hypothetical protein